jgi:Putative zinc-finger
MTSAKCSWRPLISTLIEYWLGELNFSQEAALEEHLFGCAECHARLRRLVNLGRDIRDTVREGEVGIVLTPGFVSRLQQSGLKIREYRLQPGGSVNCTIAPEDDLVVAHLHAPLAGVHRLDLVGHDGSSGKDWRIEDIAFASHSDDIAVANNSAALRRLPAAIIRMELRAVEGVRERVVASYTFNHSPHQTSSHPAP